MNDLRIVLDNLTALPALVWLGWAFLAVSVVFMTRMTFGVFRGEIELVVGNAFAAIVMALAGLACVWVFS